MRNRQWCIPALVMVFGVCISGCGKASEANTETESVEIVQESLSEAETEAAWEEACTTPLGKYPELVTYTLGKITSENNANMPGGDTYEDNNYTRYIRNLLNVQNIDIIEGQGHSQYEQVEMMAVQEGEIPDIMVVTSKDILDTLVEQDLIADLTEVYENCTSDRVKEMYASYGEDKMGVVTYDGKLMAFPETEVYTGPALLWMRKDWMDQLGLEEPQTLEEAMEIIRVFAEKNPGNAENGNVGLVFDPSMVGQSDQCFSLEPIFDYYHAYPGKWIQDKEGNMVYGSVTEEMKEALENLHTWYKEGILDQNFMIRNASNLPELLENGQSGAFFGWWWAPNNPLSSIDQSGAEWKPYLFTDEDQQVNTAISYGRHYCVVARKDFEHPEIIPKVLSALYDYARYDGKEEAEEVGQYLGMNVNPAATPFVINIDYSDAIFRVSSNIQSVMNGEKLYTDLTVLEQGYYNSCQEYLNLDQDSTNWQWAAYTSRITAVCKLAEVDIHYVNEGYTQRYDQLTSDSLTKKEEEEFIMIVTGERSADHFDVFVEEWYQEGGIDLTNTANEINKS